MHEINRPYCPDPDTADFLYKNYLLLRTAPPSISKWARQLALESLASCEHSWRVIGISEEALREIAAAGKRTTQQRGHWYPRETRYGKLFGEKQLDRDAFIKFFFEHDTTVILTKAQNNKDGDHSTWGRIIPVEEGFFPLRGYIRRQDPAFPTRGIMVAATSRRMCAPPEAPAATTRRRP